MVVVERYNTEWPVRFELHAAHLEAALGSRVTAIEHVGSTAIPGLAAKPIIDIAICVASDTDPFSLQPSIAGLGYRLHVSGPKTHAVYVRESSGVRTDILHAFTPQAWETCNQRLIRDRLLNDEDARHRYGKLKATLAASSLTGMQYTAAKRELVQNLLDSERVLRGLPPVDAWEK